MNQIKPVKIPGRKKVSLTVLIMVFISAFLFTSGVGAALTGFRTVNAEDNHIVLVDDVNVDREMKILISDSKGGDWSESINNPLEAAVYLSSDDYVKAGDIYIQNSTNLSGWVVPHVHNVKRTYLREAFTLKVEDGDGEIIYEGPFNDYDKDDGSFFMDGNEVKHLEYFFKFSNEKGFGGVRDEFLDDNGYKGDQINFDIRFHAAES